MAEETTNLGWIDAEAFAQGVNSNNAPQIGYQEYERGAVAFGLAKLGTLLSQSASSPATVDSINDAGHYQDIGLVWDAGTAISGLDVIHCITSLGNGVVLAGGGQGTGDGNVYKSIDSGKTWRAIEVNAAYESCYTICNLGNGIVLASFGNGTNDGDIFRSTDWGETWSNVYSTASAEQSWGLTYLGNGIVVFGTGTVGDADIIRSTDYGATWATVWNETTDAETVRCFTYCGGGLIIAGLVGLTAGDAAVIRSTDYGATWGSEITVDTADGLKGVYSLAYIGNSTVLAGVGVDEGDGDIYRSIDGGTTWSKVEISSTLEAVYSLKHVGGLTVLAGTGSTAGSDAQLLKSTDGGLTWTSIKTFGADSRIVSDIEYLENGILLVGISSSTEADPDIYRSVLVADEGEGYARLNVSKGNVSNPPTDAELDALYGTPADVGAGWHTIIDDAGGDANVYFVVSNGTSWWYFTATKAV